ncbi:MAG: 2-oxoglutarate dehydrogenase E1 component [Burkholderiales bacterium]|jgi:2-oxoglutarate dehydrogenase E1 component
MMNEFGGSSYLFGTNAAFVEELYDSYLEDPSSIPSDWKDYFDDLQNADRVKDVSHHQVVKSFVGFKDNGAATPSVTGLVGDVSNERKQVSVLQLINAYRFLGVRRASLDPLDRFSKPEIPELTLEHYVLGHDDLDKNFNTGSFVGPEQMSLSDILKALQDTYCGSVGTEYMYISDVQQKRWIQDRLEGPRAHPQYSSDFKLHLLERLTAAETLEKYLHTKYVGQKRFSLEGAESLIVSLDHLLQRAGQLGIQESVIGMAHRGRLNVLVNTLGKMPKDLFSEFEGKSVEQLPAGDVKYHQGFSSDLMTPGGPMHVSLAFNPSHLEIVNPVVEGSVRARQRRRNDAEGREVLPVLLHGDSAFAGQGVVMETLNLSQTRGYRTGGTVHIIINNQIGFTTSDPRDMRSTLYCSDIAKMIDAPVFHVNGDDPEAVAFVTEIALDYRMEFGKDVVIDLVCFRKLGHNEQDEPMVTQPWMYSLVKKHPGTRKKYADRLIAEGSVQGGVPEEMISHFRDAMDGGHHTNKTILSNFKPPYTVNWSAYQNIPWTHAAKTSLTLRSIKALSAKLTTVPEGFVLQPRVEKVINDRRLMSQGELPIDWGMAENLAYASLLKAGYGIRLSGQDSGRGTFFHRHAVLHDQRRQGATGGMYIPLEHIDKGQPTFSVIDSLLSEEAVLGFEYGYATTEPNELVIWEAQFGDFANGAQVVIDQFIASGEVKWGRMCGLVMMLPHGHEGQGPEHSSARIERYLQLCADYNMQICIPSTPSQMFHVLRRQMIRPYRKPLIVISPKSLLRHKQSISSLDDLVDGEFQNIIPDDAKTNPSKIKRVVFCSGKVYFELAALRKERQLDHVAIVRLEQLYPFPHDSFKAQIALYKSAKEMVWCQEEPGNQGAWHRIQHYIGRHLLKGQKLTYALRASSASPASGYSALHAKRQSAVLNAALGINE